MHAMLMMTTRTLGSRVAEPNTKRKPSAYARATAAGARKRGTAITPASAAKLLAAAVKLPKDTAGRMVGSAALCAEHGLGSPDYITRCLLPSVEALGDEDVPFERKEHCNKGVPVKLTPRKDDAMREKSLEWGFDFSFEDMAAALMELFEGFTISAQAIADHLRAADWNVGATSRAEPLLRDDLGHFKARVDFGREHRKQDWAHWVDVDEKWFYTMALRLLLKLPPDVAKPARYIRHKSHVPKTMFLCAMGRPTWDGDECTWDGKVGIWRVSKFRPAERNKYVGPNAGRRVGDPIEEDVKLDAKKYVEMMTEEVFPRIRELYAGEEKVIVQHDGAPGHTGKSTPKLLAEAGRKRKRGEPLIEVVQQPAQSPDFNINDLAFFRALSVAVRKRRRSLMRGPKRFDIDQLVDDVKQAFDEYPPEQLEKMWKHKSYVMGAVLTTKPKAGGSNYPRHDPKKRAF